MAERWTPGLRAAALWSVAAGVLVIVAGFLVAWSGVYSVAASEGHWAVTRSFLEFAMRSSVRTHSLGIASPHLDDTDLIRLGAGHFDSGCAPCHGAPGVPASPIARQMLPAPPLLSEAVRHWSPRELFWIVKNGLKYTGMPAWVAPHRDDEIWAVVAFLRRLPELDAAAYDAIVRADLPQRLGSLSGTEDSPTEMAIASCARCHGDGASAPASAYVPRLAGMSAAYLRLAMKQYAAGVRHSGIMQPIAARLSSGEMHRLAQYYSRPSPVGSGIPSMPSDAIERGRSIATAGVPAEDVPPCLACHGRGGREIFPRLAGQQAPYIVNQLKLWQRGLRDDSVTGAIMAPIARRLSPRQIEDVAAYFATLPDDAGHSGIPRNASQASTP
jgi:cytochrome c553